MPQPSTKTFVTFFLFTLAVAVVGYFVLPDSLVMQITLSGESGAVLPKPFALLIPVALSALPFILRAQSGGKALLVDIVAVLILILIFAINL